MADLHPGQALRLTWSNFPTWLGGASMPLLVKAEYKFRVESLWLRAPHILLLDLLLLLFLLLLLQ